MRRGRPRHDDVLTPREWQVLDLLREQLTNEQIAARLGISYDTAKFHVSEILTKLGVESREEAAAWQGKRRTAFGLAPLAGIAHRAASLGPLKLAAVGAIGATTVSLVVLLAGVLLSNGEPNIPSEPVATVPVQWTEADLPDPASWEAERPFQDVVGPGEEDVWRAYLVKDDGKPQLMAETHRSLIGDVTWSDGELIFKFLSRKRSSTGVLGLPIYGYVAYEPGDPNPTWERVTDEYQGTLSPDGSAMLMSPRYGDLYYYDRIGSYSMRITGFTAEQFPARFAPAGDYFYVPGFEGEASGPPIKDFLYVMRPGDAKALKLDTSTGDGFYLASWSPDGTRLAYPQGDGFVVVDLAAGTSQRFSAPVTAGPDKLLTWSTDGAYLTYAGSLYDAETGKAVYSNHASNASAPTPASGRFFATNIDREAARDACPPLGAQGAWVGGAAAAIYDIMSPNKPVFCWQGQYNGLTWLTEERLLLHAACEANCEDMGFTSTPWSEWALIDLSDGAPRSLMGGGNTTLVAGTSLGTRASLNHRFYVIDHTLSVYDAQLNPDNALLYTLQAPDDQTISSVSFSPDGRELVFITGPEIDYEALRQTP
jgi:DNA-binding CsgD family transcriptional regulator